MIGIDYTGYEYTNTIETDEPLVCKASVVCALLDGRIVEAISLLKNIVYTSFVQKPDKTALKDCFLRTQRDAEKAVLYQSYSRVFHLSQDAVQKQIEAADDTVLLDSLFQTCHCPVTMFSDAVFSYVKNLCNTHAVSPIIAQANIYVDVLAGLSMLQSSFLHIQSLRTPSVDKTTGSLKVVDISDASQQLMEIHGFLQSLERVHANFSAHNQDVMRTLLDTCTYAMDHVQRALCMLCTFNHTNERRVALESACAFFNEVVKRLSSH